MKTVWGTVAFVFACAAALAFVGLLHILLGPEGRAELEEMYRL